MSQLPIAFPAAFAYRCLSSLGQYDTRVNRICLKKGYRRTNGPFWTIFYRGKKPNARRCNEILQYWESHPKEARRLVRQLASLVNEKPDPGYLKLIK